MVHRDLLNELAIELRRNRSREWNVVLDRAIPRPVFLRRGFRNALVTPDFANAAVAEVLGVATFPVRASGPALINECSPAHAAVLVLIRKVIAFAFDVLPVVISIDLDRVLHEN